MRGFRRDDEETGALRDLLVQTAVEYGMAKTFGLAHNTQYDDWGAIASGQVKSVEDFFAEKMRRISTDLVASMARPAPSAPATIKQMAATARRRAESLRAEAAQQDAIASGLEAAAAAMGKHRG